MFSSAQRSQLSLVSVAALVCGLAGSVHAQDPQYGVAAPAAKITDVSVNGSGCPTGTSQTKLDADGLGVAVTFSEFAAAVDADQRIDVKACSLGIGVANADKYSYAVESIAFAGESKLEEGVSGKLTVTSYVQGEDDRTNVELPTDALANNFQVALELGPPPSDQLHWTECGVARNLNLLTYLSLSADASSAADSFIDLTASGESNASSGISVRVVSRPCP